MLGPYLADAELSRSNAKLKDAGADVVVTNTNEAVAAVVSLLQDVQKTQTAQVTSAPGEHAAAAAGSSLAAGMR